jgi:hypothetical protein
MMKAIISTLTERTEAATISRIASGGMVSTTGRSRNDAIEPATEEAGDEAEEGATHRTDEPGEQAQAQRLRGRCDDHRQQVTAAAIGAQQVIGRRGTVGGRRDRPRHFGIDQQRADDRHGNQR